MSIRNLLCGDGSNGKQWQYADAELAAGDIAAFAAVVEGPAGGRDPVEEVHDSIRWDQEGDKAAGTGEDAGGRPCRRVALEVVVEGEWCPSDRENCQQAAKEGE